MQEVRDVTIVYKGVAVTYWFQQQMTIQEVIDTFAKDQNYVHQMKEAHAKSGKEFIPLTDPQATQVRMNTEVGEYRNKLLKLSQFGSKKRLNFYIYPPEQAPVSEKLSTNSVLAKQQKLDVIHIGIVNSSNNISKSISIDLSKSGKFDMVEDVVQHLRLMMGYSDKTWFMFKAANQEFIYTDLKAGQNFKKFLRAKNIIEINAMPIYESG